MQVISPIAASLGAKDAEKYAANIKTLKLSPAVELFDRYPDAACLTINEAVSIAGRSRASIYRDHDAGLLPFVKLGKSTRFRVGDLRKYLGGNAL